MNERRGVNAQDQLRRPTRGLLLSLLFILALLMSLCVTLLFAQLVLSGEKQEWLKASMATKLRADYSPDEWAEMRRFAPLQAGVIEQTARDEDALSATPTTRLVPVAVAVVVITSTPFPPPSPTAVPVATPQPSLIPQPPPTLQPTATPTSPPPMDTPTSPPPMDTPTSPPPTDTPTSPPPTDTPTSPPPTDTPTSPPPTDTPTSPPPTDTPTSPPPTDRPTSLPPRINLTASPTAITADGVTTSLIRALVVDQYGNPVPDGTQVTFTTDRGTFGGATTVVAATTGGIAQVTLTSSTSAGVATVNATSGSASGSIAVQFMPWMQISKTVNRNPAPTGSVLTYTIVIQNSSAGGDDASLHTLTDTIPGGFVYVPGSTASAVFGSDPTIVGQDLTWTPLPSPYNLVSGGVITSTFQVTAQTTAGTYSNTAVIDGNNFDPVSTGDTAQVTLQGPTLSSIVPDWGYNDAPVSVTINGADFAPGATANLGAWALDVTWVNESVLNAIVPQDIAAGVYTLTVTNPGGASDMLPNAYTALNSELPDTTLDSGYLGTYGAEPVFSASGGDDDQVQVLFLEVPDTTPGPLYIRVFDPDCGGTLDIQNGLAWDTPFTYTVYGGNGAYTDPDARSAHPTTGASSGVVLATAVFTESSGTDGNWYTFALTVTEGEHVNDKYIFKLTVVGGPPSGAGTFIADLNLYNVVLSTSPTTNIAPSGSRISAFSWTFLIEAATYDTPPRMFPYVAAGVTTFTQHNWDYDNDASGVAGITITTPVQTITVPDAGVSGNDEERSSDHATFDAERNTSWAVNCWAEPVLPIQDNLVTFWATDQNGNALAIFSRSTIDPLP